MLNPSLIDIEQLKYLIVRYEEEMSMLDQKFGKRLTEPALMCLGLGIKISEKIKRQLTVIDSLFVSEIHKKPLQQIATFLKENINSINLNNSLDRKDASVLRKSFTSLNQENSDMEIILKFSISSSLETMEKTLAKFNSNSQTLKINYSEFEKVVKNLIQSKVIYPALIFNVCLNSDNLDKCNFINIQTSTLLNPSNKSICPRCNKEAAQISYFSFNSPISERIMGNGGFMPYILAYSLRSQDIAFMPSTTKADSADTSETDFIIQIGDGYGIVETKVFRTDKDADTIATNIESSIRQLEKKIKEWKEKNVTFRKKIILVNYSREQINESLEKRTGTKNMLDDSRFDLRSIYELDSLLKEIRKSTII